MSIFHVFLGISVAFLWGGNFVAAKFGLMHFQPLTITFLRFLIVAALLVPFVEIPKGRLKEILLLSVTLGVGHFVPLFMALGMGLDVATTAIAGQLGVPFSCLLGVILMGDTIGKWRGLGLLISFSGIFLVVGAPDVDTHFNAFLLVILASLCWGFSNIVMKKLESVPIMSLLGWMALFTFPQLLIAALIFENNMLEQIKTITVPAACSILYTTMFSTLVAYSLWYYLLRRHPVSSVAPFVLLIPFFASSFGVLVFDEVITPMKMIGGLITIVGVAIIIIRRPKTALQEVL